VSLNHLSFHSQCGHATGLASVPLSTKQSECARYGRRAGGRKCGRPQWAELSLAAGEPALRARWARARFEAGGHIAEWARLRRGGKAALSISAPSPCQRRLPKQQTQTNKLCHPTCARPLPFPFRLRSLKPGRLLSPSLVPSSARLFQWAEPVNVSMME